LCLCVGNRTRENHGESGGNLTACHNLSRHIEPPPCVALISLMCSSHRPRAYDADAKGR
jgi:hypothetical protein